jgi:hypothetical protein
MDQDWVTWRVVQEKERDEVMVWAQAFLVFSLDLIR